MTERAAGRAKPAYYLTSDGRVVFGKRRSRLLIVVSVLVALAFLGTLAGVGAAAVLLTQAGRTPREWAVYLRSQNIGGSPTAAKALDQVADYLNRKDRLGPSDGLVIPPSHGASEARSGDAPVGHVRAVRTVDALRDAVASSLPNDIILLAPGRYRITGGAVQFATIGNATGRLTLRAATLGDAVIESEVVEAFNVTGPFWQFENLVMRGVCPDHAKCEHAIHVAGTATDTVIRNSRFEDFNAHLKINGDRGEWPDHGVVEGSTLINTAPRQTRNPIVPIDLVGASEWRVSGNVIADFAREGGGQATYGAYFKGAGQKNVFERNVVLCAWKLKDAGGSRVGVSLGGGGTDPSQRRDRGALGMEQVGSVIRDNLIAFCSEAGIYLNRAARSTITHNTLLDTAGIDGRFIETSGDIVANIVDGAIRGREGAALRGWENDHPYLLGLFFGHHPQRAYFRDLVKLDLGWADAPDKMAPDPNDVGTDLCGETRGPLTRAGAFDDYASCLKRK